MANFVRITCLWVLWFSITFFSIGLIALSFFNHASADDYCALYKNKTFGFVGYQKYIYYNWGGRYFSNLLASIFSFKSFLISHYYLHTIVLLIFTSLATYYLVNIINKYLINNAIPLSHKIVFTALISINFYVAYPELSTALFWFSSAITYQTSIILLLLLFAESIRFFHCSSNKKLVSVGLINLLVISINGTNEVAAVLCGLILFAQLAINKEKLRANKISVFTTLIVYVISITFLAIAPGNKGRMALMDTQKSNVFFALASSLFRVFVIYWNIFQSSLFWISLLAVFMYAFKIQQKIFTLRKHTVSFKKVSLFIGIWTTILLTILVPIMIISNGSIPDRALNVLSAASIIVFTLISFYAGANVKDNNMLIGLKNEQLFCIIIVAVSCCIWANATSKAIAASLISGSTYSKVIEKREEKLWNAQQSRIDSISLPLIDLEMKSMIETSTQRATLKEWMKNKPPLLFFSDDIADTNDRKMLQDYFGLRIIYVEK